MNRVDVPSPSLGRFESQLERAIRRRYGRPWGRLPGRIVTAGTVAAAVSLAILHALPRNTPSIVHRATRSHDRVAAPAQPTTRRRATHRRDPDFDRSRYSTTDPRSMWVVVNKRHPLDPKSYAPSDLAPVGHGQYMRAEAAGALERMLAGAKRAGHVVTPDSGYRTYEYQETVYGSEVQTHGRTEADAVSARPGYSEHQTGWAVDLGSGGCNITACFGTTPGGRWAMANAYRYGFILRYPAGKMNITGYRSEPWHFRYVGRALAGEMHKDQISTLEEFFNVSGGTTYR